MQIDYKNDIGNPRKYRDKQRHVFYKAYLNKQFKELNEFNINLNLKKNLIAGDVLYKNIGLPEIKEGDKIFIFNIGANTLSTWSGHCSRDLPEFIFL